VAKIKTLFKNLYNAVMLSPRGQSGLEAKILASASKIWPGLGLGLNALASASNIWPRPGLDLVVLLCNRAFFEKNQEFC